MFRPLHHPIIWSFDMSSWTKVVGLGTSSNFCIWSLKSLGAKIGEKLLWIVVQNSKGQIEKKQLSWIPVTSYLISSMVSLSFSSRCLLSFSCRVGWRLMAGVARCNSLMASATQGGAHRGSKSAWRSARGLDLGWEELIEAHRKCWDMGSEKQKFSTHNQELVLL